MFDGIQLPVCIIHQFGFWSCSHVTVYVDRNRWHCRWLDHPPTAGIGSRMDVIMPIPNVRGRMRIRCNVARTCFFSVLLELECTCSTLFGGLLRLHRELQSSIIMNGTGIFGHQCLHLLLLMMFTLLVLILLPRRR
jgi:hypothetical protein